MEDQSLDALLRRADKAEEKRTSFASLMQDVYAFALPERDAWNSYGYGADRHTQVFDSTAVVSAARFANRLQQAMFPPQQRWARLSLPPELAAVPEAQPVQEDLEAASEILFRHIHASNFDLACNEFAQEVGAGVGAMLIENGRLGTRRASAPLLRFQAVPAALVAFDDGPWGTVEGIFFKQKMAARLVRRTYPDDQASWPKDILQLEQSDPEKEVDLLQATIYDAKKDRWCMHVVHRESKTRCLEREYRTSPWVVTRWTRAPGETHGRGPLTQALPDIRTLNKLMELMLIAASFAVLGAWTGLDDGVMNADTVRVKPGVVIPVRANGGPAGPSLKPLEFPGNWQLSEALREQLQTRVRQTMFDDPLPPEVQAGLTATEVIERVRRFQADTGAFGRLHADAVVPMVMRCVDILEEAGAFADARFKDLMAMLRQDAIRIRATSPLSQAQDQADVQAVMGFISGTAQLGEVGATMLRAGISLERAGPFVSEHMGVPHSLIPSEQELKDQAQAQSQEQQTQLLATSPVAAQVAGALAGAAAQPGEPAQPVQAQAEAA